MGRARAFLFSLLLSLPTLVFGQATAMKTITDADCDSEACSSTSAAQYCIETANPNILYRCDTVSLLYESVGQINTKVVHICPSGCEYADLNTACAGETSTAANPIVYYIHAGVYTGQDLCTGEDFATIQGDGEASVLDYGSLTGENGDLELGASTNITIQNLRFKDCHRCILSEHAAVSAGTMILRNLHMVTERVAADEDCVMWDNPGSGSRLYAMDNVCDSGADGFTLNSGGNGVRIFAGGNRFPGRGTINSPGLVKAYAMEGIPDLLEIVGDSVDIAFDGTSSSLNWVNFTGGASAISGTPVESSSGTFNAVGNSVRIRHLHTTTSTFARGVSVDSTATALDFVNLVSNNVYIDNDSSSGAAEGHKNNATGSISNIVGGKWETLGATNSDFLSGNGTTNLFGVAYDEDAATADIVGGTIRNFKAAAPVFTPTATITTTTDGTTGLTLTNTDAATSESSPSLQMCESAATSQLCLKFVVPAGASTMQLIAGASTPVVDWRQGAGIEDLYLNLRLINDSSSLYIGGGGVSDANSLLFNSAGPATLTWVDSANRLNMTGVEVTRMTALATAPATCSIGDHYIDTSGAACFCTASNTWTNVSGVGTCV